MPPAPRVAVEVWSPLPPQASGIADYVEEQLGFLEREIDITLVSDRLAQIEPRLRRRDRAIAPSLSDPSALRLYHLGNSPLHEFIYREAMRVPGVVVLHEWNLHELLLGMAVTSGDFDDYRRQMRREHGERGAVAAGTIEKTLGLQHWTSVFPLNAAILERSLALVCLSGSTAARAAARSPGTPVLHLPHHALLKANTADRGAARKRLGLGEGERVVLAPGLGTSSKSLEVARAAVASLQGRIADLSLITVGGAEGGPKTPRDLGRVDLETLGDAILAADIVLALRFPSRGEVSGVAMRALAAGRALIVSSGSTADEDLPEGVVARVPPGPAETRELAALLEFLLSDEDARVRMERLSLATASTRDVSSLSANLSAFLREVASDRAALGSRVLSRQARMSGVRPRIQTEVEAALASVGLFQLPPSVFERLVDL